jgi:3-deoxy-D-manno-octulosonate 8-phosphate phosphatase (KDO 8-P phosphatase)
VTEPELFNKLAGIKIVAMDVDGTFTDGTLFYDPQGNVFKGFSSHDGLGLELLFRAGIKRGFITGRVDSSTEARVTYLRADFYLCGIADKSEELRQLCDRFGVTVEEILYIGDDLNDLTAFETAGVAVAVGDAGEEVKKIADYVTSATGGHGAIREVVNLLMRAKNIDTMTLWKTNPGRKVGDQ